MEFEVEAHGQALTAEFLDELFVSIIHKIPDNKWVEIQKNHDQAIAGIKHIIDMDFYGAEVEVVFNPEFTHFKKRLTVERKPHPFADKLNYKPQSYWKEQDELKLAREKREYEKARLAEKKKQEQKITKRNGRKRKN